MPSLLHIEASPRKQRSASCEIAQAFINAYADIHTDTRVSTFDLWDKPLPEFDEHAMQAKYAGLSGTALTGEQQQAWDQLRDMAQRLHDADILVFSIPMWNFGIPYKLKHFIDLVSQKGILFSFDPDKGFGGLLQNKKAVVIYARGLDYSASSPMPAREFDFQKPFFDAWLKFVGVTDVHSLIVEKTLYGDVIDRAFRDQVAVDAIRLARQL